MVIPYRTAKFKLANILAIAILGSTAKFPPILFLAIQYATLNYHYGIPYSRKYWRYHPNYHYGILYSRKYWWELNLAVEPKSLLQE